MALQDALGNISPPRKAIDSFALPPVFIQQLSVPLKLSSGAVIHRWHSPRLHTLKPSYRSKGSPSLFLTYFKNQKKNPSLGTASSVLQECIPLHSPESTYTALASQQVPTAFLKVASSRSANLSIPTLKPAYTFESLAEHWLTRHPSRHQVNL